MKKLNLFLLIILALGMFNTSAQTTVTDYDGNVYNTVTIGTQTWLKENLKSLHYADGITIPGVVAYNNDEGLAAIYGRLYTWNATVRDSVATQVQGVCPCGWHVASNTEWTVLINYLGGSNVAGGKMKEAGTTHWQTPNEGADNSSGFTALPGGEYDANEFLAFRELYTSAVFWTATQYSSTKAIEKYMMYDSDDCLPYNWYKVMKYSVRCIKNPSNSVPPSLNKSNIKIVNPTGDILQLIYNGFVDLKSVEIYNMQGQLVKKEVFGNTPTNINIQELNQGFYIAKFFLGQDVYVAKFNKV